MIGVIADDLTGAAELGAIGLRHGLRAEIIFRGHPASRADLVCVDTDSRSQTAAEAARRAAAAAKLLRKAGAKWIYKKVDSVLRGQVTAEVEAVMGQLGLNRALLLPANPSLDRVIRDGQYFVRGKPIHKTEFARDPEFPRRAAQVMSLLKLPEKFSIRLSNGHRELSEGAIVIGETATSADVREWAAACDSKVLAGGGAEFFDALLAMENFPAAVNGEISSGKNSSRELFVCGTSTEAARQFTVAARRRKTPVFSLPRELAWGAEFSVGAQEAIAQRVVAAFEENSRVILNVGLSAVQGAAATRKFSDCVVELSARVLRQAKIPNVFAEGGATAAELVRHMRWTRLTVRQEHAPGVATLAVGADQSIFLTIKPGTYAWPAKWT